MSKEKTRILYKLTDSKLRTHEGFQWYSPESKKEEWVETNGLHGLCSSSYIHCYTSPLLASALRHLHVQFEIPRLFEIEVAGMVKTDYGLKVGVTKCNRTLVRELPFPLIPNKTIIRWVELMMYSREWMDKFRNRQSWHESFKGQLCLLESMIHTEKITLPLAETLEQVICEEKEKK